MLIPELAQAITTASGVTLRPAGWLARRKLL